MILKPPKCHVFLFIVSLKILLAGTSAFAQNYSAEIVISDKTKNDKSFPLVGNNKKTATIIVDSKDYKGVLRAASDIQSDIERVTDVKPALAKTVNGNGNFVLIGTLGKSELIDKLVASGKLRANGIKNKWESFLIATVNKPIAGIGQALVIAGSDKRGTIYGIYELSRRLGVSPWYWWADVPPKKRQAAYVAPCNYISKEPSVKYRGIFINDEEPAFGGWAREKFGGINSKMYQHVFELLLRLKANYLWPAMWGKAFNFDDTLNPVLADEYGIVMGTSHHEPMMRAQQEWKLFGKGPWDYAKNEAILKDFWTKGIKNIGRHESIVTIGMRGDGDEPMTEGTAINLLEKIVSDQRNIITNITGKPASEMPQVWALYKEVQDYYDKGMRVPDDITLLLCDDNWGNIRRLPKLGDAPRKGGYGIYYHYDYVGGPRNYKWINTNNIARVWEQMHLAYEYGARQIWIVNVGDLKPMEFPISFFLDYAYDVNKWNERNLDAYYKQWAAEQFGSKLGGQIGGVIKQYSQYSARRKPELLNAGTYNAVHYDELDRVMADWNGVLKEAEKLGRQISPDQYNAFYHLVLHPVKSYANLQNLYGAVAKNRLLAKQNDPLANKYAELAKQYYDQDSIISIEYNSLNNGKWNHMMDQPHIGYTYWQQPDKQKMPQVQLVPESAKPAFQAEEDALKIIQMPVISNPSKTNLFYEHEGYVSMHAEHYSRKVETAGVNWRVIPGVGKEAGGITSFPVTKDLKDFSVQNANLQYDFYTHSPGSFNIQAYFSPTLNFHNEPEGLRFGVSIDKEKPVIISLNQDDNNNRSWEQWVANNIIIKKTDHSALMPGKHTIKFWMISPGVILQKLVLDFGGVKESYLGPPDTMYNTQVNKKN